MSVASTDSAAANVDTLRRTVHVHIGCTSCGFDLFSAPQSGVCAECGTPVSWSLRGGQLHGQDADWLDGLRRGVAVLTVVAPWMVFGLTWPAFSYAFWRLSAPNPGAGGTGRLLYSLPVRLALVALPPAIWAAADWWLPSLTPATPYIGFVGALARVYLLMLIGLLLVARLAHARETRFTNWMVAVAAIATVIGSFAAAGLILGELRMISSVDADLARDAAFKLCLPVSFLAYLVVLWRLWRRVDVAETHARDARRPGSPHRAAPSPPPV